MSESENRVECHIHGWQGPAYVCRHLDLHTRIGFVEAYDPHDPDAQIYEAWCSACDEVLLREGEWNDTSEAVAKPRLVCRGCYARMKALNRSLPSA